MDIHGQDLQCLAAVPPEIQLQHSSSDLGTGITTRRLGKDGPLVQLENATFWRPAAYFKDEKATAIGLYTPAGYMLQHPTAEELITGIAKEWAHVLANHKAEQDSCDLLVNMTSGAMVAAAMFGGMFWWPLAIASVVTCVNQFWFVEKVLHRQQVYEADAIAAVISTASGATPGSVITAMQRAYCAVARLSDKEALRRTNLQRFFLHLAKLQHLLPSSQLPQTTILDSRGLQLVTNAAASEISSASMLVRAEYDEIIAALEDCIAEELCYLRNPYEALTDITPHKLDRISRIEKTIKGFSDEYGCGSGTDSGASTSRADEQHNRYTRMMTTDVTHSYDTYTILYQCMLRIMLMLWDSCTPTNLTVCKILMTHCTSQ